MGEKSQEAAYEKSLDNSVVTLVCGKPLGEPAGCQGWEPSEF
ncbi:MAG: hypothetical protein RMZ41_005850 [Nostoc sp. DedVER02]|nr:MULTISPECIES: hypothetical protein [unclassified Nostoc]MDZ7985786.1 hypothetical protein [Nostoc sp. DedVER02]MDZ8114621.1 hypothetical protein [Nostoc sp. DedVER01b]